MNFYELNKIINEDDNWDNWMPGDPEPTKTCRVRLHFNSIEPAIAVIDDDRYKHDIDLKQGDPKYGPTGVSQDVGGSFIVDLLVTLSNRAERMDGWDNLNDVIKGIKQDMHDKESGIIDYETFCDDREHVTEEP